MTFDLEAARALHDRSPDNSHVCASNCLDQNRNPYLWPCATAVALGATGRSEWLDAPAPKPGPAVTYNITADALTVTKLPTFDLSMDMEVSPEATEQLAKVLTGADHLAGTKEPERCPWILRDGTQCGEGPKGHRGHKVPQCDRTGITGNRCQLGLGHNSPHDQKPELCGHLLNEEDSCTREKGHPVNAAMPHRSNWYTWWPTEPCDGVGDVVRQGCCLAKGHKLRCHFVYGRDDNLVRCSDLSRTYTPCALPTGHTVAHADLDGMRWGGLPLVEQLPDPEPEAAPEPAVCASTYRPTEGRPFPCVLADGHAPMHDSGTGVRWTTEAAEAQPEGATWPAS